MEKCKQINPWMNFAKIEAYDFSGIEEIIVDFDSEKPYEVYNLNGVLLGHSTDNLAPGIYIVRQNGRTHKAVVR